MGLALAEFTINSILTAREEARFWSQVNKDAECWNWIGVQAGSYGQLTVDGKRRRAHRFAWEMSNGPVPRGLVVMHTCDNRLCVRVSHLRLGTDGENIRDAARKGRMKQAEHHPMAKLDQGKVERMRALRGLLTYREIAEQFGVTQTTAFNAIKGKTWRHK